MHDLSPLPLMEYNRPGVTGMDYVTHDYDARSLLTKETRHFAGLNDPDHELNYTYTLSGQLKSLTDPFGAQFTYGYDGAGQLSEVKDETTSPYAGVPTYVSGVLYRASGAVKAASFGDGFS